MRIQPKGQRLEGTGKCFLCETDLSADVDGGDAILDTMRIYDPPLQSHLTGRKYVCESCVWSMAQLLGFSKEPVIVEVEVEKPNAATEEFLAQLRYELTNARSAVPGTTTVSKAKPKEKVE